MSIIQAQSFQLINQEKNNYKFYNLSLTDDALIIRYGRIGTTGITLEKSYANQTVAEAEFAKVAAQKLRKGYEYSVSAYQSVGIQEEVNDKSKTNFLEEFPLII